MRCVQRRACPRPLHLNLLPPPTPLINYDTKTGEIVPLKDLDQDRFDKAQRMIDNLRLNGRHHLAKRLVWIWMVSRAIPDDPSEDTPDAELVRHELASRTTPWSSITRAWLVERGYSVGY